MPNVLQLPHRGYGASREEWLNFDVLLGLTADLLPVVSNPKATISQNSAMQGLGKTPSQYNANRHAVGISQWTQYQSTVQDLEKWIKENDYGICLQTREVRALDIDVTDAEQAVAIRELVGTRFNLPARVRDNSTKLLLAFRLPGDFSKRRVKTAHGMIEFLATGQQFIACGTHPSGSRYEWEGGLPDKFPTLTSAEFEDLWQALVTTFGIEAATESNASTKQQKLADVISTDPVAQHLLDKGLVKRAERDGRLHLDCPWQDEHTSETGDSSTTYWPAHTGGYVNGHFKCLHAHCEHREDHAFLDAIGYVAADVLGEFERIGAETIKDPDQIESELLKDAVKKHAFDPIPAHEFGILKKNSWLIKGVMPDSEVMMLYGASASGKTFITLDIAGAIASGTPWRGNKVKQGHVVYIAAEGADGVRKRLLAYAQAKDIDLNSLDISFIAASPNFLEKADALEVAKRIITFNKNVVLVIVDTLAKVMPGGEENSSSDMSTVISHCEGIHRAVKAPVLLIHHSGKDSSKGARGWSGTRGAVSAEFEVLRVDNDRVLTVTKLKDGEEGAEFGFKLSEVVLGLDEDDEDITSCYVDHCEAQPKNRRKKEPKGSVQKIVVRVVSDMLDLAGDGVPQSDLIEGVMAQLPDPEAGKRDTRRQHTLRAIEELVGAGWLVKNGSMFNTTERKA